MEKKRRGTSFVKTAHEQVQEAVFEDRRYQILSRLQSKFWRLSMEQIIMQLPAERPECAA